jgi:hypothetical protein
MHAYPPHRVIDPHQRFNRDEPSDADTAQETYRLVLSTGLGQDKHPLPDSPDSSEEEIRECSISNSDIGMDDFDDFLLGIRDDGVFESWTQAQDLKDSLQNLERNDNDSFFFEFRPLDSNCESLGDANMPDTSFKQLSLPNNKEGLAVQEQTQTEFPKVVKPEESVVRFADHLVPHQRDLETRGFSMMRPQFGSLLGGPMSLLETPEGIKEAELSDRNGKPPGLTNDPDQVGPPLSTREQSPDLPAYFGFPTSHMGVPSRLDDKRRLCLENRLFLRKVRTNWQAPHWYQQIANAYVSRCEIARVKPHKVGVYGVIRPPEPEAERDWIPIGSKPKESTLAKARIIRDQQLDSLSNKPMVSRIGSYIDSSTGSCTMDLIPTEAVEIPDQLEGVDSKFTTSDLLHAQEVISMLTNLARTKLELSRVDPLENFNSNAKLKFTFKSLKSQTLIVLD